MKLPKDTIRTLGTPIWSSIKRARIKMKKYRCLLVIVGWLVVAAYSSWAQQKPVQQLRHNGVVTSVVFSPDGEMLASSSLDRQIILWNAATGEPVAALPNNSSYVYALAFSPDGRTLASGSSDGKIRFWEFKSGRVLRILEGKFGGIEAIAFSPDGKFLASIDDFNQTAIWDVATGSITHLLPITGNINGLAFSPNNRVLATAGSSLILWDVTTGIQMRTVLRGSCDYYCTFGSVAFSPDGSKLASGAVNYSNFNLLLVDLSLTAEPLSLKGHSGVIYALAFSPNGETIASGSYDNTIKLWNAKTGAAIRTLTGHTSYVQSIAFSPNGKLLASGGGQFGNSNDSIILWNTSTGASLHRLNTPLPQVVAPGPNSPVIKNPALPMPATLDADPALFPPDARNLAYGDPKSRSTTPSPGPGSGNGIGSGVGPGNGGGYGPGNGGNTGGGDRREGGGGPAGGGGGTDYSKIFSGKEVTSKARILEKPEPSYTERARWNQITGTVIIKGIFSSSGQVTNLVVIASLPFGLTDRAIAAARQIRFIPPTKDGHPVSMYMQLEYNFNLY